MRVTIDNGRADGTSDTANRGVTIDYQSDFLTNKEVWKVKLKDAFRIVDVGGTKCFVKRFADKPSAFELMLKLKGRPVVNMPKVYDLVADSENNKVVHYLFLECIEGKTLKESIQENEPFNTSQLAGDILDGLAFIHDQGYWFGDFNEENIFCNKDGRYLLIDVDSCWPNELRPATDSAKPGSMPGAAQEYANIVMLFYRQILNMPQFLFEQIEGKNLNYLQFLAFTAKLACFLENKKDNSKTAYVNKKIYKDLHFFLLNKNELYCKTIFSKALGNTLQPRIVFEFSKFISGENLAPESDLPVIELFKVSDPDIFSGGNTTLLWSVKNAVDISLNTVSGNLLQKAPAASSLSVKLARTETYSLTAVNKAGRKVVKTIQVNVTQLLNPRINYFTASKLKVKKGEPVKLSWSVEQASRLFMNGAEYNLNSEGITVNPGHTSAYTITAENEAGEKVSSQVNIKVTSVNAWWFIAAAILLIFGIWQLSLYIRYNDKVKDGLTAVSSGDFETGILDYEEANSLRDEMVWKKPNLYDEIKEANGKKFYNEGENLLIKGIIVPPPTNPDSTSALNSFKNAKIYLQDDTLLNNRITFCEMIQVAHDYRLKQDWTATANAYKIAIGYGLKTNVPSGAIDSAKKVSGTVLTPKADLVDKNIEYNVADSTGTLGMRITCHIKTIFLKGVLCKDILYFYDTNGQKVLNSSASSTYQAADSQICVPETFEPTEDDQTTSCSFFIPNSVLQLTCGRFIIEVFKFDNSAVWQSGFYTFCQSN